MFANVAAHDLAVLSAAIGQDVLDEIVAELITSNYANVSRYLLVRTCGSTYYRSKAYEDDQDDLRRHAPSTGPETRCYQFLGIFR